ncbi:MAG: hemerythrin domain-containing protein [Knoellia sp.]
MCSYCGCESIAVVGRFMAEHVDIINMTTELRQACATGEDQRIGRAVDTLEHLLHPHTRNEEVGLFAVLRRQSEFRDHIDSLCDEHTALDEQLGRIRGGEHTLATTFLTELRAHIDREENGLFPASAIALGGAEWDEVDATTPAPSPGTR